MNVDGINSKWIIRQLDLGMIICDVNKNLVYINDVICEISGYNKSELMLNDWITMLFLENNIPDIENLFEKAIHCNSSKREMRLIHKRRIEKHVLIDVYMYPGPLEYLITFHDITRKKAHEKFFDLNYEKFIETTKELDVAMKRITEHREQLKNAYNELETKNDTLMSELQLAKVVQNTILPMELPNNEYIKIDASTMPYGEVNGDYYDVMEIDEDLYAILIIDATGHGMPAALITTMAKISFINYLKRYTNPAIICQKVNEQLFHLLSHSHGFYLTALIAILDISNMEMHCSNAGHHNPLHYQSNALKTVEVDLEHNFFLGLMKDVKYTYKSIKIKPGDKICFYTDGATEVRNQDGDFYGKQRIINLITKCNTSPPDVLINTIVEDIALFSTGIADPTLMRMGGFSKDDLTIMLVDIIKPFAKKERELIKNTLSKLFDEGKNFLYKKQYDSATECFNQILEIDSTSHSAYSFLGDIDYKKKNYDEALTYYQKVLKIKKNYVPCLYKIALMFFHYFKDNKKAEIYLSKILLVTSDYKKTRQYLGVIKEEKDKELRDAK